MEEPKVIAEPNSALKVFYHVESTFKEYEDHSREFKDGFLTCLRLFDIGFRKRIDYNLRYRNHELEEENKKLKKILQTKYSKIKDFERDLGISSLISGHPMELFREVLIETAIGNFTIVVNLDENTINACVTNFALRNTYKTPDECKSKLLQYINNKKEHGFKAYKDKLIAIKEGVKML